MALFLLFGTTLASIFNCSRTRLELSRFRSCTLPTRLASSILLRLTAPVLRSRSSAQVRIRLLLPGSASDLRLSFRIRVDV
jgi:hypothetical protein